MCALSNAACSLSSFTSDRPEISVTDVSRLLGMPKSSASRLLKAMREEGLLSPVTKNRRATSVGNVLFEVSQLYRLQFAADRNSPIGAPDDLPGNRSHRLHLHSRRADVLVIRMHQGPKSCACSRRWAAACRHSRLQRPHAPGAASTTKQSGIHPEPLVPPSSNRHRASTTCCDGLAEVRRVGWCEALDEAVAGVGSIAVSIADPQTGEMLAFCLSFPAHLVSKPERRRLAASLSEAARRLADQVDDRFWAKVSTMAAA